MKKSKAFSNTNQLEFDLEILPAGRGSAEIDLAKCLAHKHTLRRRKQAQKEVNEEINRHAVRLL